jgi:hypothetical protein
VIFFTSDGKSAADIHAFLPGHDNFCAVKLRLWLPVTCGTLAKRGWREL